MIILFLLVGCLQKNVAPDWMVIDRASQAADFYATGKKIIYLQKSKQVIQIGIEREFSGLKDLLFVLSYNEDGRLNWSQRFDLSDNDSPWDIVQSNDENLILLTENNLLAITQTGQILWQANLPKIQVEDISASNGRSLILWNNQIVVFGQGLFIFNQAGELIRQINSDHVVWSGLIYQNHLFAFGTGRLNIFNDQWQLLKELKLSQTSLPPAVSVIQKQNLIMAALSETHRDGVEVTAIDSDYQIQWKTILPDPSENSFDLPGFPIIQKLGNEAILVVYSQHPYREIYKLRSSDGKILGHIHNKNGIAQTLIVHEQKYILIHGEKTTELYDQNLNLLMTSQLDIDSDITSGGMTLGDQGLYIGGGMIHGQTMRTWLAKLTKPKSQKK